VSSPQAVENSQESLETPEGGAGAWFLWQRAPQLYARMPSGNLGYEPRRYRAALLRNRGASGLQLSGFQADVEGSHRISGREAIRNDGCRAARGSSEPVMAEGFQCGPWRAARQSTAIGRCRRRKSARIEGASCIRERWGLAPFSRQDEDDDEQRGDRRNTPKNLHLITPVPRQPSSEELDRSCR
jgi:hypothetical protein